ncbi:MAG: hypothetical protein H7246_14765 [Phycisphaerae bacterium]|nr:hypothetical protein [Saprospiraceae bacterium]
MKTSISKIQYSLGFIALLSLLSSCSPAIYNANAINAPLLSKKGNTKISLGSTLGTEVLFNNNLQGAYAISDHLGLMVNSMQHKFRRTNSSFGSSSTSRHKEIFTEAGLGYYSAIGNSSKWRWECYGGFGLGKTRETEPNNELIISAPFRRFFAQPSIGFVSRYFDAALSVRGSYLSVGQINWVGDIRNGTTVHGAIIEPCLTIRAGGRRIKPFLQYSWMFPEDRLAPVIDLDGLIAKFFTLQLGVSLNLKG